MLHIVDWVYLLGFSERELVEKMGGVEKLMSLGTPLKATVIESSPNALTTTRIKDEKQGTVSQSTLAGGKVIHAPN